MANDNEVIIHVKAEDDTAAGFTKVKASAKKTGEELERAFKSHGLAAGRALADGIHDGLKQGTPRIKQQARSLGEDVEDILARHGRAGGAELGQGISDGLGTHAPDIKTQAGVLGDGIEDELRDAGRKGGQSLADGIKDGMEDAKSSKGGDGLIPDLAVAGAKAGAKGGKAVASSLMSTLAEELSGAKGPAIAGAVLAALATVGPLVAANIGAAVIGSGGALGIVGGFLAASKDPRLRGAVQAMGDMIEDDLKEAGKSFAPAAVEAVGQVKTAWKTVLPDIESVFTKSEGLIEPFLDGILDGVASLVAGIDDSLGDAGPVMEAFGDLVRDVGGDLGEMFAELGDDSPYLADSLGILSGTFGVLSDAITEVISFSAKWISQFAVIERGIDDAAESLRPLAETLGLVSDETNTVSLENAEWHDSAIDAADAVNDQVEAMRTLEEEMRKQTDPLFEVLDLQDRVAIAQSKYNKAVEKFGKDSPQARDELRKMGKATFDLTSALSDAASEGFNGGLTPAMRTALKAAGLTTDQMDELEKELKAAKRAGDSWAKTYVAKYHVKYSSSGSKTGNFGEGGDYSGVGGLASGGIKGAASGASWSGLTMVGEHGPELIDLPAGSRVSSAPDTQRMLSGGHPAGGIPSFSSQTLKLVLDPSAGSKLTRAIMEMIRAEIRTEGGNVQTVLGVSGVG